PVKLKTDAKEAVRPDKYNRVEFTPIVARSLRIKCTRGEGAVGIYRIKTYLTPVVSVDDVFVAVKTGVKPTLPSRVTAKTADGLPVSLRTLWFDRALKTDADGEYIVEGSAEPFATPVRAVVTARGDMDKATITTVDDVCVSTYAGEAPALPKFALVRYNNGAADNISKRIVWGDIPKSTYAELGTQTITGAGKIEGTDIPVTLTITVI
ncbi:MAG TPA: Ig-like domain-containing protein, partial [Bacillota bacterium]|nr:Ig-like domain-containing protein [Bacillota bacterium]